METNFVWNECPESVDEAKKYAIDENDHRIVSKPNNNGFHATVTGGTSLPLDTIITWDVKIVSLADAHDTCSTLVGVAPFDIDQNSDNFNNKYGWYIHCTESKLHSGPPHNYTEKDYAPIKEGSGKKSISTGDIVTLTMDTVQGSLSFAVNGESFGVAYEGIPLDKPLVPCIVIESGSTIELIENDLNSQSDDADPTPIISLDDKKEEIATPVTVPVPSNITLKNSTWNSITITWDAVEGVSFYQVEVDKGDVLDMATTNRFTKRKLLPKSKHSFRVRAVIGDTEGKWSSSVREKTQKIIDYKGCWKECHGKVDEERRYTVDKKFLRIATKANSGMRNEYCTVIGTAAFPLDNAVTWDAKILRTWNGEKIYIGVAPYSIKQNEDDNHFRCGWFFNCYNSTLASGYPHNYKNKEYGPRKGDGEYIKEGDVVSVFIDTKRGDVSFIVNGEDLGVAFERVPLGRPLVPCVLLGCYADSVELYANKKKRKKK